MWKPMNKEGLGLEPSVPLNEDVYLGCGQKQIEPDPILIAEKREHFHRRCFSSASGKPESVAEGDLLQELLEQSSSSADKKPKKKNKSKVSPKPRRRE